MSATSAVADPLPGRAEGARTGALSPSQRSGGAVEGDAAFDFSEVLSEVGQPEDSKGSAPAEEETGSAEAGASRSPRLLPAAHSWTLAWPPLDGAGANGDLQPLPDGQLEAERGSTPRAGSRPSKDALANGKPTAGSVSRTLGPASSEGAAGSNQIEREALFGLTTEGSPDDAARATGRLARSQGVPGPGSSFSGNGQAGAMHLEAKVAIVRQETHFSPAASLEGSLTTPRAVSARIEAESAESAEPPAIRSGDPGSETGATSQRLDGRDRPSRVPRGLSGGNGTGGGLGPAESRSQADRSQGSPESDGSAANDVAATAARQAPTLAPAPLAPAAQIAGRVAGELTSQVNWVSAGSEGISAGQKPGAQVLRVLEIRLEPAELGTVSVRMSLRGSALEVHVAADRADTARLVQQDRDVLADRLQAAGYSLDTLVIQARDPDRAAVFNAASGGQVPPGTLAQSQSGGAGGGARPGSANTSGREAARQGAQGSNDDTGGPNDRSAAGGLYV
jgi:chemotaxis protein MotD